MTVVPSLVTDSITICFAFVYCLSRPPNTLTPNTSRNVFFSLDYNLRFPLMQFCEQTHYYQSISLDIKVILAKVFAFAFRKWDQEGG